MNRVLVTGGTGFIGRHCLEVLVTRGVEVHTVTSRPVEEAVHAVRADVRWHRRDLLAPEGCGRLLETVRPSHLLHCAWTVEGWARTPVGVHRPWVRASVDLLDAFLRVGGRRVVMVGSCTEYDWSHGLCEERITPRRPDSAYGQQKDRLRRLLAEACDQAGASQAWGTVFFLYGPHQPPDRLVPSVIRSLLAGEPARCSPGEQKRDFLHVEDVAGALVALLESDVEGPVNVASGEATAVKEIVLHLARILDGEELVELGALPAASEEPLVVASVERLAEEVGYRPGYDLEAGLKQTIEWWRNRLSTVGGPA